MIYGQSFRRYFNVPADNLPTRRFHTPVPKLRCHRTELLVAFVSAISLTVAGWMTINREAGFDVNLQSYTELAGMSDGSTITSINSGPNGGLELGVSSVEATGWVVADDLGNVNEMTYPRIPPSEGIRRWTLTPRPAGPTIRLTTMAGNGVPDPIVHGSNLPIHASLPFAIRDFAISVSDLPEQDATLVRLWLERNGIFNLESDEKKALRIAALLHQELQPHRGQPEPFMRELNGYGQYVAATEGRSGVYCANHAEIYAFFATVAGLPTRLVDVGGRAVGISLAAHAFAETYFAHLGDWAYVDLQLDTALIHGAQGYLNGMDVMIAGRSDSEAGLRLYRLDNGRALERPFSERSRLLRDFIPPEATLTYLWASERRFTLPARLARLLLIPQPAFSLRQGGPDARLRLLLTYGGGLALIVIVALRLRHWAGSCSCGARGD